MARYKHTGFRLRMLNAKTLGIHLGMRALIQLAHLPNVGCCHLAWGI